MTTTKHVTISSPDVHSDPTHPWLISGDLRSEGSGWDESNRDYEPAIIDQLGDLQNDVIFDSESSQFFAETVDFQTAQAVADACEAVAETKPWENYEQTIATDTSQATG